jgi:two-component system LytT family response regulator
MRAIIIENEEDARELLTTLIAEYIPEVSIVGQSSTVKGGVELIDTEEPELVFLDIDLDDGTGFDLLDQIDEPEFAVIFVTAYDDYALKAFKYNAIDYLLKPYTVSDLTKSIEKAGASLNTGIVYKKLRTLVNQIQGRPKGKIPIYTIDGITIYHIDEIVRFEGDRAYCKLFLDGKREILVSKPLRELEAVLPLNVFFRVHKSHLININFVKKYSKEEGGFITMNNGDQVPISRRKKDDFIAFLTGNVE